MWFELWLTALALDGRVEEALAQLVEPRSWSTDELPLLDLLGGQILLAADRREEASRALWASFQATQDWLTLLLALTSGIELDLRGMAGQPGYVGAATGFVLGEGDDPEAILALAVAELPPGAVPYQEALAHTVIGLGFERRGDPQRAATHYRAAIAADPVHTDATRWALLRLAAWEEAR